MYLDSDSRLEEEVTNIRKSGSSWPAFGNLRSTLHFGATAYFVKVDHDTVMGYWNTIQKCRETCGPLGYAAEGLRFA
jgi:hypothetical protein